MRILRITAEGLPLFRQKLDIVLYAQQRVAEDDRGSLYGIGNNIWLNTANAFIGINASGKTSVLRVIRLALSIVQNEAINQAEEKIVLGESACAVFNIFYLSKGRVCRLETKLTALTSPGGEPRYTITGESLWEKSFSNVRSKKYLTDFTGMSPSAVRTGNEDYLPDDVSFIIARNKREADPFVVYDLSEITDTNVMPELEYIPEGVIEFLDPTIEKLYFEKKGMASRRTLIHLQFHDQPEIVLNDARELNRYLSSGTIKGVATFSTAIRVLKTGGYLLVDEIENHFNREIVATLVRFFVDSDLNRYGGTLIFTTHYPELLDIYDRNDSIYIVRNRKGITAENLSAILKRNDIKKSEAYQSGFLEGTTPAYEAYIALKKSIDASLGHG